MKGVLTVQQADCGPQFPADVANAVALDVTITDTDWKLIQSLWQAGVTNIGLYRLLRLRARSRQEPVNLDRPAPLAGASRADRGSAMARRPRPGNEGTPQPRSRARKSPPGVPIGALAYFCLVLLGGLLVAGAAADRRPARV
jgi:hypothetical protein